MSYWNQTKFPIHRVRQVNRWTFLPSVWKTSLAAFGHLFIAKKEEKHKMPTHGSEATRVEARRFVLGQCRSWNLKRMGWCMGFCLPAISNLLCFHWNTEHVHMRKEYKYWQNRYFTKYLSEVEKSAPTKFTMGPDKLISIHIYCKTTFLTIILRNVSFFTICIHFLK